MLQKKVRDQNLTYLKGDGPNEILTQKKIMTINKESGHNLLLILEKICVKYLKSNSYESEW